MIKKIKNSHHTTVFNGSLILIVFLFSRIRVRNLFLYNDDLKKAKFSFGHLISHKHQETGKHDMKVRFRY